MTSHRSDDSKVARNAGIAVAVFAILGAGVLGAVAGRAISPELPPVAEPRVEYVEVPAAEPTAEPLVSLVDQFADQTCQIIADDPTSAGVWAAAAALEDGPAQLDDAAAWSAVSTFTTIQCTGFDRLVTDTIAAVPGG